MHFFVGFGVNVSEAGGAIPVRGRGTDGGGPTSSQVCYACLASSPISYSALVLPSLFDFMVFSFPFFLGGLRSVSCGRLAVRIPSAGELLVVVEA